MSDPTAERLDGLSPSAKLVFKVLEHNASLTQKEIIQRSRLSGRTVRNALDQLERIEAVEKGVCIHDARQNRYELAVATAQPEAELDD